MALVGMITAVTAIEAKIKAEFTRLGTNSFSIVSGNSMRRGSSNGMAAKRFEALTYDEARRFQNQFTIAPLVSITARASFNTTVKHDAETTNPNVNVIGCDEHYLQISSYTLNEGRIFTRQEVEQGDNVIILGQDVIEKLFLHGESPINKTVRINSNAYRVVGTLKSKGNTMGFAGDNQCLIPTQNVKKCFDSANTDYTIQVQAKDSKDLGRLVSEAVNAMRVIRGDELGETESFEVRMSNGLVEELTSLISGITNGGIFIGIITLLGASIGLMNIMLVSVTERTREIGIRKALGATPGRIRLQFLIESIVGVAILPNKTGCWITCAVR
jgi:putative ABC transport system permease protein